MGNDWVKKNWWIFPVCPLVLTLFVWLGGEVVMHLWNWLLPVLFGVRQITFWQALGVLILSRILFGGWGGGGHDHSKSKWPSDEKWKKMSREEREKVREEMCSRWCGGEAPARESKETA